MRRRGWIAIAFACTGACHEAPPHEAARISIPPASATIEPAASASTSAASQYWTPAAKQPGTDAELSALCGHWRVTGTDLKLFAYTDGITLKLEVEADTAAYRKGEIRFELDMSMNNTGFRVHDHARVDPGDKVFSERGRERCSYVSSVMGVEAENLNALVVDATTLRVHRLVWKATFEMDADGHIDRCMHTHMIDEPWDELRRVK